MNAKNETVDKLTAELAAIDQERMAIKARGQAVKAKLEAALLEEQAGNWGLTVEEYAVVKGKASALSLAEGKLFAVQTQLKKLTAKASNTNYTEVGRTAFAAEAKKLEAMLPSLEKAVIEANREPLNVHLNRARQGKGLAAKKAQSVKASTKG